MMLPRDFVINKCFCYLHFLIRFSMRFRRQRKRLETIQAQMCKMVCIKCLPFDPVMACSKKWPTGDGLYKKWKKICFVTLIPKDNKNAKTFFSGKIFRKWRSSLLHRYWQGDYERRLSNTQKAWMLVRWCEERIAGFCGMIFQPSLSPSLRWIGCAVSHWTASFPPRRSIERSGWDIMSMNVIYLVTKKVWKCDAKKFEM